MTTGRINQVYMSHRKCGRACTFTWYHQAVPNIIANPPLSRRNAATWQSYRINSCMCPGAVTKESQWSNSNSQEPGLTHPAAVQEMDLGQPPRLSKKWISDSRPQGTQFPEMKLREAALSRHIVVQHWMGKGAAQPHT